MGTEKAKEGKQRLCLIWVLRQAIIDILQLSSPSQHFLKSKILHSSVFKHIQLLDPTSQKWMWKTGYKNNPRDDKKTIVALSCFRPYLTTKLHMVWSVWIFLCKRLKLKKWFKQDIIIIFKKLNIFQESSLTENHHFLFPLSIIFPYYLWKKKGLIFLNC